MIYKLKKEKIKAFCVYNGYEIAGEYEDAGKSGKSIEGRVSFNQMMEDIKSGKDEVLMSLYSNFPDLAEMQQMYLLHYR